MRLYKLFFAITTVSLLASCGGSSDNGASGTTELTNSPTEFFNISSIEGASIDFSTPITFGELVENELSAVIGSETYRAQDYAYDINDNLSEVITYNEDGSILEQRIYFYTFNNEQVSNREEIIDFGIIYNETWNEGVPQSGSILSLNGLFDELNFVFDTNDANQVVRIFQVINGENILQRESQFSSVNTSSASIGDEISTIFFDENMIETERLSYSYDHDNNIAIVIGLNTVNFYVHNSETKQTIRLSSDLDEFTNDALTNIVINVYNYAKANSCGDYSEQETRAFSILTPTCITNLTYNN